MGKEELKGFKIFGFCGEDLRVKLNEILPTEFRNRFTIAESNLDAYVGISLEKESDRLSALKAIYNELYANIYTENNSSLAQVAYEYMELKRTKLAVAESLTGGLVCSSLVDIEGMSRFLIEGIVSYSNTSKAARLNVSENSLKETAVSKKVAKQMVEGLLMSGYADMGLSTTGYASICDNIDCKVGLVYIGVGDMDKIEVYRNIFDGSRNEIRQKAANAALFYLIKRLKDSFDAKEYDNIIKE